MNRKRSTWDHLLDSTVGRVVLFLILASLCVLFLRYVLKQEARTLFVEVSNSTGEVVAVRDCRGVIVPGYRTLVDLDESKYNYVTCWVK